MTKKVLCLFLAACLFALCTPALAAGDLCGQTAQALQKMVPQPSFGASGGEWSVFALARWGGEVPRQYFDGYLSRLTETVRRSEGVLHKRKYSEYSRAVIALTALGENPRDVGGYDLLAPLADGENTVRQGVNGAVYALLALDCGGYALPGARERYLDFLLNRELPGGGFALAGEMADPDVTAMALQALARYRGDGEVDAVIDRALARLSRMQKATGGYEGWGSDSCDSTAQVIVALGELGVALDDARFVKNGVGLLDNLLSYRLPDGSFSHTPGGESNLMATEQAFYALVSVQRLREGKSSLYRMTQPVLPDARALARMGRAVFYLAFGL